MSERIAVVTGAASGIGLAIAQALAAKGHKVVLADLNAEAGNREAEKIGGFFVQADLSTRQGCRALADAVLAKFGRCDILVNNAGIQHVARVEDFPVERWDAIIAINMSSAFHATRLALPAMQKADWGRIINVASIHGLVASAQKSAYVTAKHGVVGFTKVTALENATTGVTCNAICPGWVLTPLVQKQVDAKAAAMGVSNEEATKALLGEKEPSMQFTTPEELGELAVFFCSPAANNVRGVAWNMDGGWTAQ